MTILLMIAQAKAAIDVIARRKEWPAAAKLDALGDILRYAEKQDLKLRAAIRKAKKAEP